MSQPDSDFLLLILIVMVEMKHNMRDEVNHLSSQEVNLTVLFRFLLAKLANMEALPLTAHPY